MNARQRYIETMTFGKPDRAFLLYPWLWEGTLERWHSEGLPPDVWVDEYFETDRYETIPVASASCPVPEREVLRAEGDTRIVRRAGEGQIIREFTERPDLTCPSGSTTRSRPATTGSRSSSPCSNPYSPARYPLWWDDYVPLRSGPRLPAGRQCRLVLRLGAQLDGPGAPRPT